MESDGFNSGSSDDEDSCSMEEFSTEKDHEQFHDPLGIWKSKREGNCLETWVSPRSGF